MLKISNKSRHTKKQYKKRNYSKKYKKNKNKKNKNNSKKMKGGAPTPLTTTARAQRLEALKAGRALLRQEKQEMKNSDTRLAINELTRLGQFLDTSFETHKKRLELLKKYGAFNYPNNYQKINFKKKIKQNYPVRKNQRNTIKTLKSLNTYWGSNESKNSVFKVNPTKVKPQFKHYQNFELQLR